MNSYDFFSTRFNSSFPQCADGILLAKYQKLMKELFSGCDVFMLLLNNEGEFFVHNDPGISCLEHPSVLLHLLTNGVSNLFTNSLQKKPYQGIFNKKCELVTQFFVCSAIKATNGRLLGAFGVVGWQQKSLLPDEKAFFQWLAENLAQDIQSEMMTASSSVARPSSLPGLLIPYLDDIYMLVDRDGMIISLASQVPLAIKDRISTQGGTLTTVFGQGHDVLFSSLLELCASTAKKQSSVMNLLNGKDEHTYSVSCNVFSEGWYLMTFHDVTERNRMRALLDSRKQLLEGIVQASNIGIILLSSDGCVIYSNEKANQWFPFHRQLNDLKMSASHWDYSAADSAESSPFQQVFQQQSDVKDLRYSVNEEPLGFRVFSLSATFIPADFDRPARATVFIQDVTERALLDQSMLDMEQQMQFLLHASPVVIYQMMPMQLGMFTYISPNAEAILGDHAGKLSEGTGHWQHLIHPEDVSEVLESFNDKQDSITEYRLWVEARGDYRWFKDMRRFAADNVNAFWIGALLDITERKEAELKQQQTQQKFDMLLQHVPGMLYQYEQKPDGSSCFPFATMGIHAIYGVSPEQVLHNASCAFKVIHPDDIQRVSDSIQQSASTLRKWSCHYRVNIASGKTIWVEGEATPTKMPDGSTLWHGYIRDRTEQQLIEKKNEGLQEELSSTLDSLVDAVIRINKQGIILNLNPATCHMFGYSKADLLGENIAMLMPPSVAQHHDGYMQNFMNTGEAKIIGIGREVNALHAQGYEFPIALSISEITQGETISFVGCCHDLTLLKKQQEQLLHSEKLSAVGKLTSSLAHDFNNILGIVRGYAEMLQQESNQVAKLAQPIIDASDRASVMITQLLDFSSSKTRALTAIHVNKHLKILAPLLEKTLSKDIHIRLSLTKPDVIIDVEQPAFDNALINMAVNACHAMKNQPDGEFTIATELCSGQQLPSELEGSDKAFVSISLTDSGCGMSHDVMNQVFEPFFTTKGNDGTGLGLAQTYGMVQRCNGKILVRSKPGKGTSFTLYFPCRCLAAAKETKQTVQAGNHLSSTQSSGNTNPLFNRQKLGEVNTSNTSSNALGRILLVDDELELLDMNAMLLESSGYTVFKANSAREALRIAKQTPFDLLLSDIMMPEMNGLELAEQLKVDYPTITVQLMSGFASNSLVKSHQGNQWFDQRMVKPVPLTRLIQRIHQLLCE